MHGRYPHDKCLNRFLDQFMVYVFFFALPFPFYLQRDHRHRYDNVGRMIRSACWAAQLEKI